MRKSVNDMTDLEKWAVFFQYAGEPTYREAVNKVIASKEELQMAGELLMSISQDERERAVFRSRRMYQPDLQSDLATAEDRGERRGRADSIQNLMDSMGWTVDQAMAALKIPEEDRAKYAKILNN